MKTKVNNDGAAFLQMICIRSNMQNRTIFVNSRAILDMNQWELSICHEIQKYSLCSNDSKYAFKFFLVALVLELYAFWYQVPQKCPFSKNVIFSCVFTIKLENLSNSRN